MIYLQQHLQKNFGVFFISISRIPQIIDAEMSSLQFAYTVTFGKVYKPKVYMLFCYICPKSRILGYSP